jgi:hypothetical protein
LKLVRSALSGIRTAEEQRKAADSIRSAVADARRALSSGISEALARLGVFADGKRVELASLPAPWYALTDIARPALQRSRADLAGRSSGTAARIARETLEDAETLSRHLEAALPQWDLHADVRPRIALLRPLCTYVER